jgi:hypothetical protein
MSLVDLVNHATDKKRFQSIEDYINFCVRYLEYIDTGLQARIVSQNESHYQFFQYQTRPYPPITDRSTTTIQESPQSIEHYHLRTIEQNPRCA